MDKLDCMYLQDCEIEDFSLSLCKNTFSKTTHIYVITIFRY